jgi:hypothetical protein
MQTRAENISSNQLIDTLVFGHRGEWEKHEIGASCSFVKELSAADFALKARVAQRFHELGFVPSFFKEQGKEFVALEQVHEAANYSDIEQAFVAQILTRVT